MNLQFLLEQNQVLEKTIIECVHEIPFDVFSDWKLNQQKIGENLADAAFCCIAKKYDAYILANPVNPASYAHFTRSDVQSKTFDIREQTIRTGLRNGFLESGKPEYPMKPLTFCIQGRQFYGVIRTNKECLVKEMRSSDTLLKASCYRDNSFIVSDVDLVSIIFRNNFEETLFDSTYGQLTAQQLILIQDLNRHFQDLVSRYSGSTTFKLVAHGPASHFSHSRASHLHFPMKVHTPSGLIQFLGDPMNPQSTKEFLDFNRKIETLGYSAYLNPLWNFSL